MLLSVVGAAVASLVPLAVVERLLAAAVRDAGQCRYAAEALVGYALAELQARPDWSLVLDGTETASLHGALRRIDLPSGPVSLDALSAGFGPLEPGGWGADTPAWTLFAWGPVRNLAPAATASNVHVAVWVADDERDGDGNPRRDSNGRVLVRAEAFGSAGGQRAVLALVAREAPAPVALRVLDWRVP